MNARKFIEILEEDIQENKEAFIHNLSEENTTYCDWIEIFSGWMEWLDKDCKMYHPDWIGEEFDDRLSETN